MNDGNCEWVSVCNVRKPESYDCICINLKPGTYGYKEALVGHLYYSKQSCCWICSSENEILENVTHWMEKPTVIKESIDG